MMCKKCSVMRFCVFNNPDDIVSTVRTNACDKFVIQLRELDSVT